MSLSYDFDPITGEYSNSRDDYKTSFLHQGQPSPFSCLPTAFAMVMGTPVSRIVTAIGHDDPRGFHVQECLSFALEMGWTFTPFEFEPTVDSPACRNPACSDECAECGGTRRWNLVPNVSPVDQLLSSHHGVLTGKLKGAEGFHAVAWDHKLKKCLDPRGIVLDLESFEVATFWLGTKVGGV